MSKTQPKPFRAAEETEDVAPLPEPERKWFPIDSAPVEPEAEFFVRSINKGKPVRVRYRKTRAFDGARRVWRPFLKMYDTATGINLSFKPAEWAEIG